MSFLTFNYKYIMNKLKLDLNNFHNQTKQKIVESHQFDFKSVAILYLSLHCSIEESLKWEEDWTKHPNSIQLSAGMKLKATSYPPFP